MEVLAGPSSASSQTRIAHGERLDGHVEEGCRTTPLSTLRVHVRPARSIFSEALNFCCSAIVLEVAADSLRGGLFCVIILLPDRELFPPHRCRRSAGSGFHCRPGGPRREERIWDPWRRP